MRLRWVTLGIVGLSLTLAACGAPADQKALPSTDLLQTAQGLATPTPPLIIQQLDAQATNESAAAQVTAIYRTQVAVDEATRVAVQATNDTINATSTAVAAGVATQTQAADDAAGTRVASVTDTYITQVANDATQRAAVTATAMMDAEQTRQQQATAAAIAATQQAEAAARDRQRAEWWDRTFYSVGGLLSDVTRWLIIGAAVVVAAFIVIGGTLAIAIGSRLLSALADKNKNQARKLMLLRGPDGRLYDYDEGQKRYMVVENRPPLLPPGTPDRPFNDLPEAGVTLPTAEGEEDEQDFTDVAEAVMDDNLLTITDIHGTRTMEKKNPTREAKERRDYVLVMKLMRDSMTYHKLHVAEGLDPLRIPGWRQLNTLDGARGAAAGKPRWSGSSWSRATKAIEAHIASSQGGVAGGTFISGQYGSLAEFYERLGRHRHVHFI